MGTEEYNNYFKNSLEEINIRLDQAERKISKLEDNSFGITMSEEQKGRMQKSEDDLKGLTRQNR